QLFGSDSGDHAEGVECADCAGSTGVPLAIYVHGEAAGREIISSGEAWMITAFRADRGLGSQVSPVPVGHPEARREAAEGGEVGLGDGIAEIDPREKFCVPMQREGGILIPELCAPALAHRVELIEKCFQASPIPGA